MLELVSAECLRRGDQTLLTRWTEGKGSPRAFYLEDGFEPTGRLVDAETEGPKLLT